MSDSNPPAVLRAARPDQAVVTVCRWPDPLLDRFGYDPRSPYVERFWLPIVGPSGTVLLRRLAEGFDGGDESYPLDLAIVAQALGMARPDGPSASFRRTLDRVSSFGFVRFPDPVTMAVRPRLPGLTRRQLQRLPPALRADHDAWHAGQPTDEVIGTRVQHLAVSLLQLGEDPPAVEDHLLRLDFHPTVVQRALRSAVERATTSPRSADERSAQGNDAA